MRNIVSKYLEQLRDYASEVRVPGLDIASKPIPLSEIFVELSVQLEIRDTRIQLGVTKSQDLEIRHATEAHRDESDPKPATRPASQALTEHQRMVILGEPGQGKSTLLRQYAVSIAATSSSDRLPVLIELGRKRSWARTTGDNFEWLHDRLPEALLHALGSEQLLAKLADVPTPPGPTPRQLGRDHLVQLQVGEQPTRSDHR
jgi:energy-coupling factor transporter ATP-binding protein EcfA2